MGKQYQIGSVVFGSWIIKKKIGAGSFGEVFEIQRNDFGETYRAALKVITVPQSEVELHNALAEGMSQAQAEKYFYSVVEDVVREFALMARLKGTANVVGYEDHAVVRHADGIGWDILIRMELLTPLLSHAKENPFTRRDVIRLGIDMCRALELCQKYNIIHRDIKPGNIFVSDNGDFKLGDFGIARTIEKAMADMSRKGTFNYMAPEVYCGSEYGFSADIYSLGIVLYRLLNKNRGPFLPPAPTPITSKDNEYALVRRMSGADVPPPYYAAGRLAEIVRKACSYDPRARYSSPGQMRQELEAILYDQRDAAFIYPEGDEVALPENQYALSVRNREKAEERTVNQSSAGGAVEATVKSTVLEVTKTEIDGTTVGTTYIEKRVVQQEEIKQPPEKKKRKIGGMAWVLIGVACLIAAGVVFFLVRHQQIQQQKRLEAERLQQYQQLMSDGTALCETDPIEAGELFLEAQGICPEEVAPYTSYAYSLYCAAEYEACIDYIEDDLALGKNFDAAAQSRLSEILGAAYFELHDYAAAASFFRLSTAGGDITVAAMRDYAVSLGRLGDFAAADEILTEMISAGADSDVTAYVQAEVNYALEDYLAAESGFVSVLEETKDVVLQKRALRSLAEVYRDCSALVRTNQSPILTPATKEAELLAWGIAEFGLRYDSTLWEMLALAYFEAYHTDSDVSEDYLTKSAECFNRVIELGVTKDYLYSNLYTIYYELKEYDLAEKALSDYAQVFPNDYMPHALRGILLITIENQKDQLDRDYSAAKEAYETAGAMIRSNDDATYYQQLESLIQQLETQGWF